MAPTIKCLVPAIDIDGSVNGIALDEAGTLWVVATYFTATGEARGQLYRWSGSAWQPVGDVLDSAVYDIAIIGGQPVVAGAFNMQARRPSATSHDSTA